MQRTRLNLVLGVVVIALAAAIFFSQKKEEKKPPLTTLVPENISHVTIEHPGSATIKLEKQAAGWMLLEPVKTEADKLEVNGILSLATLEQKKTLMPAEVKLSDLGLEPPQYSVTLDEQKLLIGGMEPLQFQRYIKLGDVIALTDDPPGAALDQDYADLVSKSIVPEGAEIAKIEIPTLTLENAAEGKWFLSPPDPAAGADQMEKLAQSWKNAKSLWNELDVNAKDVKGEAATVTLKDGRVLKFLVVSRDPQLVLRRADLGVKFNLSKALSDELLKLPAPPPPPKAPDATPAAGSTEPATGSEPPANPASPATPEKK